jgi:hypothetical protein
LSTAQRKAELHEDVIQPWSQAGRFDWQAPDLQCRASYPTGWKSVQFTTVEYPRGLSPPGARWPVGYASAFAVMPVVPLPRWAFGMV